MRSSASEGGILPQLANSRLRTLVPVEDLDISIVLSDPRWNEDGENWELGFGDEEEID